ncbi:unnamed protein product [Spirodela intermedia]|uniref:Uncharacterized protein n=1 Tax=Spirodela intermedia TaxID=51605 RepID=A0A7I8IDE1_SPIIN|nr:unnamed protein product [Spirodela intermedia]CAA6655405.1 unnamed protein product [Spirodela intermedia]
MGPDVWRWSLGVFYIIAVATIWIAASYIVQSVVDSGVSPFLITYICNSLFVVYLPIVEIARFFGDSIEKIQFLPSEEDDHTQIHSDPERVNLLQESNPSSEIRFSANPHGDQSIDAITNRQSMLMQPQVKKWIQRAPLDMPFWFFAQLTFNLSLKHSCSSFSIALRSLHHSDPQKVADEGKGGRASMAEFLGYLGLFNLLIFSPVALILNFTKLEPFRILSWKQLSLVVGKGLLDNVLSDYLWAKAVLLTTTTAATAGLTIQVPMAALVDSLTAIPHISWTTLAAPPSWSDSQGSASPPAAAVSLELHPSSLKLILVMILIPFQLSLNLSAVSSSTMISAIRPKKLHLSFNPQGKLNNINN